MKNLLTLAFVLVFLAGCSDNSTLISSMDEAPESEMAANNSNGKKLLEICHLDADSGTYSTVIIPLESYKAHYNHGDGKPGREVPGQPNYIFDNDCQPQGEYTFVDFQEASETVGDRGTANAAYVWRFDVPVNGNLVGVGLSLVDDGNVPGYSWEGNTYFSSGSEVCRYPIVSIQARANLNGRVERIDYYGYDINPYAHLVTPWDWANGDLPTLIVENMVIDHNEASCN